MYGEVEKSESTMNVESEIESLKRRMDNYVENNGEEHRVLRKKIKIIIAILVEKKLIGDAMMKAIEETYPKDKISAKSLIEWLFEN